ncbi:hypothetical protein HHX47_DHR8000226 [Lentinula edodes]|nr:hypothetical protein HHX47_DHR8000226 [Lentinula edodes]
MPPKTQAQSRANSEENTFFTTAQSFAPFSDSISAIGQPRRRNRGFGPATVPTTSTLPEAMEEEQQFEYSTLYTGDGQPVQVLTPRRGQPPMVAPARGHSTTQIESPILQAIARRTGKQPQRRAASESPRDPPPHFDLDAGDHDDQDPPVDPDDPGADNNHDDLDDDSGGLPRGEPGDPSGPHSPISPDIPNEQRAMLELLSGFKGSIETLGTVLAALGRSSDSSESKSKVKEPEVFDGSDPRKLKTFFINLALVFNDRPKYFTDQRKVNYTLSYLSGSAKEWFVPDILDPDLDSLPAWTSSFKALVKELQDNFGIYDAQGEAEDSLGNLKMKETENIQKYNIRFNTLAVSTNWDSAALKWAYGRGLAECIKDEMAHLPEPATLADYRQEVLRIDNRYWKREETRKREAGKPFVARNPKKGSSDFKTGSTNQQNNSQPSGSSAPFTPKPKPFSGGKPQNSSNSGQSGGQRPAFNHLGADGKVLPSEKERRMKNNLCLFCGGKHQIADCNKRKARESKGRAAKVEETPKATIEVVEEESEN